MPPPPAPFLCRQTDLSCRVTLWCRRPSIISFHAVWLHPSEHLWPAGWHSSALHALGPVHSHPMNHPGSSTWNTAARTALRWLADHSSFAFLSLNRSFCLPDITGESDCFKLLTAAYHCLWPHLGSSKLRRASSSTRTPNTCSTGFSPTSQHLPSPSGGRDGHVWFGRDPSFSLSSTTYPAFHPAGSSF